MNDHDDAIDDLLAQAEEWPDTPAKVDLIDEAVRIADSAHDIERGYEARVMLMETALEAAQPNRMTVAFGWCLAQADREPRSIDVEQILWQYRWVIDELVQFPQVPRAEIERLMADMMRRYRRIGSTMRAVHLLRMNVYLSLNDFAKAQRQHRAWKKCRRDRWSDDAETEKSFGFHFVCATGTAQEAADLACRTIACKVDDPDCFGPNAASILEPLVELGRIADALRVQKAGYRYVAKQPRELTNVASHIRFFARLNLFPAAIKAFQDHVRIALQSMLLLDRYEFHAAALVLAGRLIRAGRTAYPFKLPREFPVGPRGKDYDLKQMAAWYREDVEKIGSAFDARNGNDYYAERLKEIDAFIAAPTIA